MALKTSIEVDLVAVETADEVAVLLDIAAPQVTAPARPGGHRLDQVAETVSLVIRPADVVPAFTLWNELPVTGVDDGVMVDLGDVHAGAKRRILLSFHVHGVPELGATTICELEVRWVDLASMTERVATVPVNVNVVPGDVAAGRAANGGDAARVAGC
jgi:hypothetical protein